MFPAKQIRPAANNLATSSGGDDLLTMPDIYITYFPDLNDDPF
jgi:hypothetical protein